MERKKITFPTKGDLKDWCPAFKKALILSLMFTFWAFLFEDESTYFKTLESIKSIVIQLSFCFIAGLFTVIGIVQAFATSFLNHPSKDLKKTDPVLYEKLISRYRFFSKEGGSYKRFKNNLIQIIKICVFSLFYCIALELKFPLYWKYLNLLHCFVLVFLIIFIVLQSIRQIKIINKF